MPYNWETEFTKKGWARIDDHEFCDAFTNTTVSKAQYGRTCDVEWTFSDNSTVGCSVEYGSFGDDDPQIVYWRKITGSTPGQR